MAQDQKNAKIGHIGALNQSKKALCKVAFIRAVACERHLVAKRSNEEVSKKANVIDIPR